MFKMQTKTTSHKAQSAMEYLMTYGWAILILAVVLAVLFGLGLFNGNNLTGTKCIAAPGFLCVNPIYLHSDSNIIVELGQDTGVNWIGANFVFVPQGTPLNANGIPEISFIASPANTLLANQGMLSSTSQTFYLPVNGLTTDVAIVGTIEEGGIWVQYTYTYQAGGIQVKQVSYSQIAQLTVKAS